MMSRVVRQFVVCQRQSRRQTCSSSGPSAFRSCTMADGTPLDAGTARRTLAPVQSMGAWNLTMGVVQVQVEGVTAHIAYLQLDVAFAIRRGCATKYFEDKTKEELGIPYARICSCIPSCLWPRGIFLQAPLFSCLSSRSDTAMLRCPSAARLSSSLSSYRLQRSVRRANAGHVGTKGACTEQHNMQRSNVNGK